MIHESAIVDASARIADGVEVGPWTRIGPDVEIGRGTRVESHVVIHGPTRIGSENHIHPFCSIGGDPQDKKHDGERTWLEIGDRNVIRESCTFNRGTRLGGGTTRVGDDNWIMAYVHVAHDCAIGSNVIMANGTTLAGHVTVGDRATFGAFTVVHQFCAVGKHSFSAMGTVIVKDVPPFVTVSGNPARPHGLNAEGLRRSGFDADRIQALRRAYKVVYRQGMTVEQALARLESDRDEFTDDVAHLVDCVRAATRGIVR